MSVDIRTTGIKPVRKSFEHLRERFGDKTATRYQEIAYDTQPTANFHYKPLWDPDRELYDPRRTAIRMQDWYAFKDPRQFYYGAYTMTRAKQQEALDRQMEFVTKRDLLRELPDDTQRRIISTIVPLRHYEWGANMNNTHIAAYGYGTIITQAAMMHATDRLGMAQHISRIGLLIDGNSGDSLSAARELWLEDDAWQGLRERMEAMFVLDDWFELFVAQNLLTDGLVYPLFFEQLDSAMAIGNGPALSTVTDYLSTWHAESDRWVDACIKTAVKESDDNFALLDGWISQWLPGLIDALRPLAHLGLGEAGDAAMDDVAGGLAQRLGKLGLSVPDGVGVAA